MRPLLVLMLLAAALAGPRPAHAGGAPAPLILAHGPGGVLWIAQHYSPEVIRYDPDGTARYYPIASDASPTSLAVDRAGNVWLAETGSGRIGRLSPDGELREYPLPVAGQRPSEIVLGPDGNLWFTAENYIGRITPDGLAAEYELPSGTSPGYLVDGPDGALWFVDYANDAIMRATTSGQISTYPLTSLRDAQDHWIGITGLAVGPDRNLWFSEMYNGRIGRITTAGAITEFPLTGMPLPRPVAIASAHGAIWFAVADISDVANRRVPAIGRLTTGGSMTLYPLSEGDAMPSQFLSGPGDSVWFADAGYPWLGRIGTAGLIRYIPLWGVETDPAGTAIPTLYTATRAAYTAWTASPGIPPARHDRFAPGTRDVAFYFAYTGAHPGATRIWAVISRFDDTLLVRGVTHVLARASGGFMASFTYSPAFPPGIYRLDVWADARPIASTGFIVDR